MRPAEVRKTRLIFAAPCLERMTAERFTQAPCLELAQSRDEPQIPAEQFSQNGGAGCPRKARAGCSGACWSPGGRRLRDYLQRGAMAVSHPVPMLPVLATVALGNKMAGGTRGGLNLLFIREPRGRA
jgi:hypothetical protein